MKRTKPAEERKEKRNKTMKINEEHSNVKLLRLKGRVTTSTPALLC
jgi:hypothetical protein